MTDEQGYRFSILGVRDDVTAADYRARVLRAATVAGIEHDIDIEGRGQCAYLTVNFYATPGEQNAFHAALDAEGLVAAKD